MDDPPGAQAILVNEVPPNSCQLQWSELLVSMWVTQKHPSSSGFRLRSLWSLFRSSRVVHDVDNPSHSFLYFPCLVGLTSPVATLVFGGSIPQMCGKNATQIHQPSRPIPIIPLPQGPGPSRAKCPVWSLDSPTAWQYEQCLRQNWRQLYESWELEPDDIEVIMDYSPECRQIGGIKRPSLLNILSAIEVMGLMRSPSTLPTLIRERKKSGSLKME